MGPTRFRGLGGGSGAVVNAPATSPQNGSGGAGSLRVGPINFSPAASEFGNVTSGRITLAMLNTIILGMLAFYWWTHSAQGSA